MTRSCVIIGLGQIGMGYDLDRDTYNPSVYTHAKAISTDPRFQLVAGVDTSASKRERFSRHYGAPAFGRIDEALWHAKPEIVVIATPSTSHGSVLAEVLKFARPKLVLCEKPLAHTPEEGNAMIAMCERAGIELFVNYMRRTDPGVLEIKRRIDCGEISTPAKLTVWYSKGLINNGSHFVNLLEMWLGEVIGVRTIDPGRSWGDHDPEPDAEVVFRTGTAIFRAAWEESFSHCCLELLSHSGRLRYDQGGSKIEWQGVRDDPNFYGYKILIPEGEGIPNGMDSYQRYVYDHIYEYMRGRATSLCTGPQALKTLETISSIIKARGHE